VRGQSKLQVPSKTQHCCDDNYYLRIIRTRRVLLPCDFPPFGAISTRPSMDDPPLFVLSSYCDDDNTVWTMYHVVCCCDDDETMMKMRCFIVCGLAACTWFLSTIDLSMSDHHHTGILSVWVSRPCLCSIPKGPVSLEAEVRSSLIVALALCGFDHCYALVERSTVIASRVLHETRLDRGGGDKGGFPPPPQKKMVVGFPTDAGQRQRSLSSIIITRQILIAY
jgi:hypothetical protein